MVSIIYSMISPFDIGGLNSAGSHQSQFKGLIDDVRIYNRALSATEVKNLYDSY